MLSNPFALLRLYVRGKAASRYAARHRIPGMEFDRFGRKLGLRLLMKGFRAGFSYLLNPVSITRYFEFSFALSCLPEHPTQCLDVSSPRLFSLYVADKNPRAHILMINPDCQDISQALAITARLKITTLHGECCSVEILSSRYETYDCIWSISVIEHISGKHDDLHAVKLMYDALSNGGRLILTIPVDRRLWNEYRDRAYYGMQAEQSPTGKYFFQRFYDKTAIWERIVAPIGQEPSVIRWFGEALPGRYMAYVQRWMHEGYACTVEDPREIADYYREFSTWEEMPGTGVCGLMIEKKS